MIHIYILWCYIGRREGVCKKGDTWTIISAPGIDWDSCFITPECRNIDAFEKLVDTFNKFDLTQMQTKPTREKSILDLYNINKPDLVKTCKAIPGISDHHAVVVGMSVRSQASKKPPHKVYL